MALSQIVYSAVANLRTVDSVASISKSALLREARLLARAEAQRRRFDDLEAAPLYDLAIEVVEDVFHSLTWTKDAPVKSSKNLEGWAHRHLDSIEENWRCLGVEREILREAAEKYLETPWLWSKSLDWLFLDTLTFAEYLSTFNFVRANTLPATYCAALHANTLKAILLASLWRLIKFSIAWSLWLAVAAGLFLVHPALTVGWLAYTAFVKYRRHKAIAKIQDLLSSMFATYANFDTLSQSWEVVWFELNKSRERGAVWDGVLYRLVELRKAQRSDPSTLYLPLSQETSVPAS